MSCFAWQTNPIGWPDVSAEPSKEEKIESLGVIFYNDFLKKNINYCQKRNRELDRIKGLLINFLSYRIIYAIQDLRIICELL